MRHLDGWEEKMRCLDTSEELTLSWYHGEHNSQSTEFRIQPDPTPDCVSRTTEACAKSFALHFALRTIYKFGSQSHGFPQGLSSFFPRPFFPQVFSSPCSGSLAVYASADATVLRSLVCQGDRVCLCTSWTLVGGQSAFIRLDSAQHVCLSPVQ
jgi:hypothetical protein